MIETHAHVHAHAFDRDRPEVVARAFSAGLSYLLEVNIDPPGWPRAVALAESDPRIFTTVGVHPHDTGRATLDDLEALRPNLAHPKVVAVGECGLDYYRDYAPYDRQRAFFRRHVQWAREDRLPLVVHSRQKPEGESAHADVLAILEEEGGGEVWGVLHCFSGDVAVAKRAHALGFRLGLGGAITYGPAQKQPWVLSLAEAVGPESFVLETDCPYLTPHPRRSDRNEPAQIPAIATVLARYLGMEVAEIERLTDQAAEAVFGFSTRSARPGANDSGA